MKPTSITVTGTTTQGAVASPSRADSEFTTGEQTTVQEITVNWPAPPSADDLAAFVRDYGPAYALTHEWVAAARYWRIFKQGTGGGFAVRRVIMRETPGGADVTTKPFAIAGFDQANADNVFGTDDLWQATSIRPDSEKWIGQDFGVGNEKNIVEVRLTSALNGMPTEFVIQHSDDGTTWADAWAVTTTAWASYETRTFTRP